MNPEKRDAPELQQTLLAFSTSKRARSTTSERKLVTEVWPILEAGSASLVHSQDIQTSHSMNVVDVHNTSSGADILTELQVPDVGRSSPQDIDAIEINESTSPISHYDVGDILNGIILVRNLSDAAKENYLSHHFIPGKNFQSFQKQAVVRGKTKQKRVLVFKPDQPENIYKEPLHLEDRY